MSSSIIPALRYHDAPKAVEWLEQAFGFKPHLVVPSAAGGIDHAEMTLGSGMIMFGSVRDNDYDDLVTTVPRVGKPTAGLYVVLEGDVDYHAAGAEKGGASILIPPKDEDYGGRDYTCADFEGNVWTFGTYNPWKQA